MVSPCMGCERRERGCHATCGEYAEFAKKCADIRRERYRDNEHSRYMHDVAERYRKMKKSSLGKDCKFRFRAKK